MRIVHLVRHGEVHNPDHVVYADLDGFGLSEVGEDQARSAARHLASRPIAAVIHSPLLRAAQTAAFVAALHDVAMERDDRLTEWHLAARWAGIVWEDLPKERPGELEAYLEHPNDLAFSPESLATVATRFSAAVDAAIARHPDGELVFVAHQDPVQAARIAMTGGDLAVLHVDKPQHAEVITLVEQDDGAGRWEQLGRWAPPQARVFPPVRRNAANGPGR